VTNSNVSEYLLAGKDARQPALLLLNGTYTYGQLSSACNSFAAYLISMGGRKGDRVIVIADNSFFWVAAYLGTLRAGLVCVPLPTSIAASELDYVLANTEARFGFVQHCMLARLAPSMRQMALVADRTTPDVPAAISLLDIDSGVTSAILETGGDDLAALMFT